MHTEALWARGRSEFQSISLFSFLFRIPGRTHEAGLCNLLCLRRSTVLAKLSTPGITHPRKRAPLSTASVTNPQLHRCHLRRCRPRRLPRLRRPRSARAAHGHAAPAPARLLARSAALSPLLALVRGGSGRVHRIPCICALRPDQRCAQEHSATRWRHPRPARRHGAQRAATR